MIRGQAIVGYARHCWTLLAADINTNNFIVSGIHALGKNPEGAGSMYYLDTTSLLTSETHFQWFSPTRPSFLHFHFYFFFILRNSTTPTIPATTTTPNSIKQRTNGFFAGVFSGRSTVIVLTARFVFPVASVAFA